MTTDIALPQTQQQAWLTLAAKKNELTDELKALELKAQQILLPVQESNSYSDIDTALATYRKQHSEIVEKRKAFTNYIDSGIVQPLMAYEKRVDPKVNTEYIQLSAQSLRFRKLEADKVARANAKSAEIAQFRAHVHNEYARIEVQFKADCRKVITEVYAMSLETKTKATTEYFEGIVANIQASPMNKFQPQLLTREEAMEIYKEMQAPDFSAIKEEMNAEFENVFANFESDLANAEAALKHQQEQAQLAEIAEQKELQEESAITNLITTSEAITIAEPAIKKSFQVVVVESEVWAKSVIANFITQLPNLTKYIRVKSWSKLSIGQMAEYLGRYATDNNGVQLKGIELKEIEK